MESELLTRGVSEIIDKNSLQEKLKSGKKLRVKLGIDPTSPDLHLGRSIPLLKLQDFQKEGHKIIFIVGDFTGVIGDTSDKDSERPMLDRDTIKKNLDTYVSQASKIIDIENAEIHYNSEWLEKLGYEEIGKQANVFSLSDFIDRENIKKRLDGGKRVSLREVLYPLMQGYDSVAIKADIELGGTDQRFNLLAGRDMQKMYGQEPQDIIMGPLLEGVDGRKMSSSFGNTINLNDAPNDMYGKVMGVSDDLIIKYFTLVTRVPLREISKLDEDLKGGKNPRDIKMILAKTITRMYHSAEAADSAEKYFIDTFSLGKIPERVEELSPKSFLLLDILVESGLASSKSEARRLVGQGGVKVDSEVVQDIDMEVKSGSLVQKGKAGFLKIV